jgi:dipeptide/tripeptide permease
MNNGEDNLSFYLTGKLNILIPKQTFNMESIALAPILKEETDKHPKEMYRVAFTTMWDMFSFYGMKALLIAYIVTQLRLGQPMGLRYLGTYAALVFGFNFFRGHGGR